MPTLCVIVLVVGVSFSSYSPTRIVPLATRKLSGDEVSPHDTISPPAVQRGVAAAASGGFAGFTTISASPLSDDDVQTFPPSYLPTLPPHLNLLSFRFSSLSLNLVSNFHPVFVTSFSFFLPRTSVLSHFCSLSLSLSVFVLLLCYNVLFIILFSKLLSVHHIDD